MRDTHQSSPGGCFVFYPFLALFDEKKENVFSLFLDIFGLLIKNVFYVYV